MLIRSVMLIQNDDKDSLWVFGSLEEDSGHEDVLLLSEMERQAEEQQLEEQWRERHHEAYNIEQERTKILWYIETVTKNVLIFCAKRSKLIT